MAGKSTFLRFVLVAGMMSLGGAQGVSAQTAVSPTSALALSSPAIRRQTTPPPSCAATARITPICGHHGPEDMEVTPGGRYLLVSETGSFLGHGGGEVGLALVDLKSRKTTALVPQVAPRAGWGEPDCTPPTALKPHGIHLSRRTDGQWQLLVVNHGGRESIEFYELIPSGERFELFWHGCVLSAAQPFNDIVATREGFVATVPLTKPLHNSVRGLDGRDTGFLVEWSPKQHLMRLPNSDAPFNNGVQLSEDGRYAIFAAWTGKEVRKYDLVQRKIVVSTKLDFHPDNLTVGGDGVVIAAGIKTLQTMLGCAAIKDEFCPAGFAVARIDTRTMDATPVYESGPGPIPGASVALQIGRDLYVGSFTGNRILKIRLDQSGERRDR